MIESDLYDDIMIEATRLGHRLFRNNVGVAQYHRRGRVSFVPYGVGGVGGSDFLGWSSIVITPEMIGKKIAIFTACEVKSGDGGLTADQRRFISAVNSAGGIGFVARSAEEVKETLCQEKMLKNR